MNKKEAYDIIITKKEEYGDMIMGRIFVKSQQLAEYRVKAGFTQNSLAKESQTSSALISRLEANKANPRPSSAIKICRALGVEFDDLFSYSDATDLIEEATN